MKTIPYSRQYIDNRDICEVVKVLRSDWITQGPKIKEFETATAKYCGVKYAVATSSGTAALHIACLAAGLQKGNEAITTPLTFVASANCILFCQAKPQFADVEPDTLNIDPLEIIKRINKRTKAIIPVDFSGHPCDLGEIKSIARKHNLVVIEDACHALGAEYNGKKTGSLSDMTIFSFHPAKHITTGEGGMVVTNNKIFYERLLLFRNHGITREKKKFKEKDLRFIGPWYYEMQELGFNYRITNFQCALGLSQLKKMKYFINRRRSIARLYNDAFGKIAQISLPCEKKYVKSSYHLYTIRIKRGNLLPERKKLFEKLRSLGIGVNVHYIPVHLQPYYRIKFGYQRGNFPQAERFYDSAITLPLYPRMTDKEIKKVIACVKSLV